MLAYYYHNLSPFLIKFSPNFGIRWYGLAYIAGFLIGYFLCQHWRKQGWLPLSAQEIEALMTQVIILGTLIGGRLGYCLLYDWPTTVTKPWSILQVWKGGMSSHGGIVGLLIASAIFAKRHQTSIWRLWDALALAAPPGIFLGRLANFMNGELWGRAANVPWAVIFPDSPTPLQPRHPSQLYEAVLEGIILGFILWAVKRKTKTPGFIFATLLITYPLLRIVGEQFREPDAQIGFWFGFLTQGQLLSLLMLMSGLAVSWKLWKNPPLPIFKPRKKH
ncbi:MAG: prolipoprotein diacylglyceryl transferase [Verrucomicrobiae bacterium]|nr:prolipoprotein diacylglyceryl transferase [Verrucomicrobiae bacterium]